MNRIKIELPPAFPFSTILHVRITDLNYGGHVGNDSFLSLFHEARQQYLQHLGYAELQFEGYGLIMADAAIEYKAELSHRDEIQVSVAPANFTRLGFDLYYKMEIVRGSEKILAAKAKTGMLCYDYAAKKVVSLPEQARQKLDF